MLGRFFVLPMALVLQSLFLQVTHPTLRTQAIPDFLTLLKEAGYRIVALEQAPTSISLPLYKKPEKLALVLGEEVHGIPEDLLAHCDDIVEIPMVGQKESFNVSVAAAIALYQLSLF